MYHEMKNPAGFFGGRRLNQSEGCHSNLKTYVFTVGGSVLCLKNGVSSLMPLWQIIYEEVPSRVSFQWRKYGKVPSRVQFQWRKCGKGYTRVFLQWRRHNEVSSRVPVQWRKCGKSCFQWTKRAKMPSRVHFLQRNCGKVPFQWGKCFKMASWVPLQQRMGYLFEKLKKKESPSIYQESTLPFLLLRLSYELQRTLGQIKGAGKVDFVQKRKWNFNYLLLISRTRSKQEDHWAQKERAKIQNFR